MKRNHLRICLVVITAGLILLSLSAASNQSASAGQGKGGEVVAKPTPTPKKTTPKRTTPARTTNNSKTNQATKSASEVASAAEMIFWNSIKDSANAEDFKEYLKQYPNGRFAGLARNRLSALETAAKEEAARKEEAKKEADKREEAKRREEAEKKRPGAVVKNSIGMELVYVPAGSFMMGDTENNHVAKPVHQVTIREGFYMGRYEVTQALWQQVVGSNPSRFKGDNLPVEKVSWYDAQEFIRKLNARDDGYLYRLPTEAEWEYACRAGTTGKHAGNLDAMAWYSDNSGDARLSNVSDTKKLESNNNRTHPVGQKQPNAWGLYDMHGNVFEWCEDWFHDNYDGAPTDGRSAWLSGGEQSDRVLRGGSWFNDEIGVRSSFRYRAPPETHFDLLGFRVVAVARTQ